MKKTFILLFILALGLVSSAQVVINEIIPEQNAVELKNTGTMDVNIGPLRLCTFPAYNQIASLTFISGDMMLAPGEIAVVTGHPFNANDGELGLYLNSDWGNSNSIIDYVEWGSTNHQRSSVATGAGIWPAGDFTPAIPVGSALAWDAQGEDADNWILQEATLGEENFGGGCEAIGGTIATQDPTTICAGDGEADPINVTLEGNEGTNSAWVITNEAGEILGLPAGSPFDLDGAGAGVCLLWHLSFEDNLIGAEVGLNANDLEGCFSLSNPITVTRNQPEGGTIATEDETTICAGDSIPDPINVTLEANEGTNSAWVITDESGEILGLPAGSTIDLEGAGAGVCLIWHLSFEDGLVGAEVGLNANDLEGCFSLSNSIAVTRLTGEDCGQICNAEGGTISTEDPTTICAGDSIPDLINVTLEGNEGTNSAWVITDESGEILGLPAGSTIDLEGAGAGVCLIWHLSFEDGLVGAEVGLNANDLEGCFSLSNSIAVTRLTGEDCNEDCNVIAGSITTASATEICVGDGISDNIVIELEGNVGTNSQFVITNEDGLILALPADSIVNLEGAGAGVCLIWHLSFEDGLVGAQPGLNANDLEGCFALSEPITVTRTAIDGGSVETSDGETEIDIIVGDGLADEIAFVTTSTLGQYAYIITDSLGNVLDILDDVSSFDFEGAEAGVCHVYGFSYTGNLIADPFPNIDELTSTECFELSSNFIEVNRTLFITVEEERTLQLSAYPNPTSDMVSIDLGEFDVNQYNVVDATGRTLISASSFGNRLQIDLSSLATGQYFIQLEGAFGIQQIAILKK